MRRSRKTNKMVSNIKYIQELGEEVPTKETMDELAHIAIHGMPSDSIEDALDSYFLGVAMKHHGDFPDYEE